MSVGEKAAFPMNLGLDQDGRQQHVRGMTYGEWLLGQCLRSCLEHRGGAKTVEELVDIALAATNDAIAKLDAERAGRRGEP